MKDGLGAESGCSDVNDAITSLMHIPANICGEKLSLPPVVKVLKIKISHNLKSFYYKSKQ